MGYTCHHAICITAFDRNLIEPALAEAQRLGCTVSPIIESPINGYCSIFVAPDGSKEGWEPSMRGDDQRAALKEWLRTPGHYYDWVEVRYGDDAHITIVVASSDHDYLEGLGS